MFSFISTEHPRREVGWLASAFGHDPSQHLSEARARSKIHYNARRFAVQPWRPIRRSVLLFNGPSWLRSILQREPGFGPYVQLGERHSTHFAGLFAPSCVPRVCHQRRHHDDRNLRVRLHAERWPLFHCRVSGVQIFASYANARRWSQSEVAHVFGADCATHPEESQSIRRFVCGKGLWNRELWFKSSLCWILYFV